MVGLERTVCDCELCTTNCRFIPGFLVPGDLRPLFENYNPKQLTPKAWMFDNLLASPGATVLGPKGVFQVPTIVPGRKPDGSCRFLNEKGHCDIHARAPYGCAVFDVHQSQEESDQRCAAGLRTIMTSRLYAKLWSLLDAKGLKATPVAENRKKMAQYLEQRKNP